MERGREMLAAMGLQHPIAIHPGAGARWKRWPGGRFAGLMQELIRRGHQVVLIEGPADDEAVAEVQQQIAAEIPVLRQQPLRLLAASLAQCTLFAGNDSGVTHLAAAVGTPTLALFGPTDPLSWTPLENHPETIRVLRHCTCRTAYRGQVRVCDDPDCMQSIEIAEVLQAAQDLLANVQNPVENRRYSVDNFVDPPSTTGADTYHHHFNTPSSSQGPRV
jgi:ADP-heptose:LPS heptosyltransferase